MAEDLHTTYIITTNSVPGVNILRFVPLPPTSHLNRITLDSKYTLAIPFKSVTRKVGPPPSPLPTCLSIYLVTLSYFYRFVIVLIKGYFFSFSSVQPTMSISILHDMGAPPQLLLSGYFQGLGPYIGRNWLSVELRKATVKHSYLRKTKILARTAWICKFW